MNLSDARQMIGKLAARLLRRSLFLRGLLSRRCLQRGLSFGFRRLQLFELQFELFKLAAHALGRGAE